MREIRKTVAIRMGAGVIGRYELSCELGPEESESDGLARLLFAAQARFEDEGFSPAEEGQARFEIVD